MKYYNLVKLGMSGIKSHIVNKLYGYMPDRLDPIPSSIHIYPTFRCDLQCAHCFIENREFNEITADDWCRVIDGLCRWIGPFQLNISGGEPYMRKDLIDILKYARGKGVYTVVVTNGTMIDNGMAEAMLENGPDSLTVSINGYEKAYSVISENCDYQKKFEIVENLKEKIKITVLTTIMNCNLDEIPAVMEFCRKNGVSMRLQGIFINEKNAFLWPEEKEKVKELFSSIYKIKKQYKFIQDSYAYLRAMSDYYEEKEVRKVSRCSSYIGHLRIFPDGSAGICSRRFGSIGNVVTDDPETVWNSDRSRQIRNKLRRCTDNCDYLRCYGYETVFEKTSKLISAFARGVV